MNVQEIFEKMYRDAVSPECLDLSARQNPEFKPVADAYRYFCVSKRIRELRGLFGDSLTDLAEKIGCCEHLIDAIEKREMEPTDGFIEAVSEIYHVREMCVSGYEPISTHFELDEAIIIK